MNESLRRWRLRTLVATSVAWPIALGASLFSRPPDPVVREFPPELMGDAPTGRGALWARDDLWGAHSIRTELLPAPPGTEGTVLVVRALEDPGLPDLLLYWSQSGSAPPGRLPDDSFLLGRLAGLQPRQLRMPRESIGRMAERSAGTFGVLHLYSSVLGEVVDSARIPVGGWGAGGSAR